MACPPQNVKFQLRRDTLCNWLNGNPLLLQGEPAFETDTNSFKIGDGINKWNTLPYIQSPLVFTQNANVATLTGYKENGQILTVRSTDLSNNMLHINLAAFTPSLSAQAIPSNSLNWDVQCTGFSVSVVNPSDFTTEYINAVSSILVLSGVFSPVANFTAGIQSTTPAGGVNWTQTFATNSNAVIQPISSSISGGGASCNIFFHAVGYTASSCDTTTGGPNGGAYSTPAFLSISWATPTASISAAPLSGKTFLDTYTTTTYAVSVTGISNPSNYLHNITAVGGQLSNTTGPGTFTFTVPIHKDNVTSITRSVTTVTTFNRPITVTGTAYSVNLTATSTVTATFTYPTFWLFTPGTPIVPTASNIVTGNSFSSGVTLVGDQVSGLSGFIINSTSNPLGFWLGVRTAATQPNTFRTGASPALLSDVAVTRGNSVTLGPTPLPSGYTLENYTLYGITLQSGSTYMSIS